METFIRVYAVASIALIVVGATLRTRREPERKRYWIGIAVAMSAAVLAGAWIANGMAL